jgi:hypothetical protein
LRLRKPAEVTVEVLVEMAVAMTVARVAAERLLTQHRLWLVCRVLQR